MNTIIAYNTITGNTEICVEWIRETLEGMGHSVDVQDVSDIFPIVLENYDLIILGSPTYGYGNVTAQFELFLERLVSVNLSGKKAAVFALGDSELYDEDYTTAAEILEDDLTATGAALIVESLRIDGNPTGHEDQIRRWAKLIGDSSIIKESP
jgi:flavodoxin I